MSRAYAARRLLELGPLTLAEFVKITGWPYFAANMVLMRLLEAGAVKQSCERGTRRYLYGLQ